MQNVVQLSRRIEVAAKRLLDDEARVDVETGSGRAQRRQCQKGWGNRRIVQRPLRAAEHLLQCCQRSCGFVGRLRCYNEEAEELIELRRIDALLLMLSVARPLSCSTVQPALATPTIGTLTPSSPTSPRAPGGSALKARSPEAPKNTKASDSAASVSRSLRALQFGNSVDRRHAGSARAADRQSHSLVGMPFETVLAGSPS